MHQLFFFRIDEFVAEALLISHIIGPNRQQQSKPIVGYEQSWYLEDNTFVA